MTVSSLSLRDLEYVVAVAEHRHFGRAAEACAVSQPALSAQVRKVEDVLGVRLFERTKRRVLITGVGSEVVAADARLLAVAPPRRRALAALGVGGRDRARSTARTAHTSLTECATRSTMEA